MRSLPRVIEVTSEHSLQSWVLRKHLSTFHDLLMVVSVAQIPFAEVIRDFRLERGLVSLFKEARPEEASKPDMGFNLKLAVKAYARASY